MTSDTNDRGYGPDGRDAGTPPTVWLMRLSLLVDDGELARLHATLSTDERQRAARGNPDVRRRFVACRGRLRKVLARVLHVEPGEVRFCYGKQGKPALEGEAAQGWKFNVSHSDDVAIFALSRAEVGVDLELPRGRHALESLSTSAPLMLAEVERLAWLMLPGAERIEALLQTWVAKEALLKAVGQGIGAGMDHFALPMPVGPVPRLVSGSTRILPLQRPRSCQDPGFGPDVPGVSLFAAASGEYAAVACVGAACRVCVTPFEQVMNGGELPP